jgi:hypothetical protein
MLSRERQVQHGAARIGCGQLHRRSYLPFLKGLVTILSAPYCGTVPIYFLTYFTMLIKQQDCDRFIKHAQALGCALDEIIGLMRLNKTSTCKQIHDAALATRTD